MSDQRVQKILSNRKVVQSCGLGFAGEENDVLADVFYHVENSVPERFVCYSTTIARE